MAVIEQYEVEAYNLSHASENKIHDDAIARKLGFTGALVPGVEVYAYASHLFIRHWGRAWLERGTADIRFFKPVYDGRIARCTSEATATGIKVTVESEGQLCASGEAALPEGPAPELGEYRAVTPPAERPPASEATLAEGTWLATRPVVMDATTHAAYLRDVREASPLYAAEGLVHPGQILRLCNQALTQNVVVNPWIHVGSRLRNLALARVGQEMVARARVVSNYDRKGHRLLDMDVLVLADGRPVTQVLHTAVWRPRQLAEAA